jgi:hypothetical protein
MAGPGAQVLPSQLVMIDDFLIDVILNETHEFENEVTEYPVESGSNITDNVRPKPIVVTMECLVSNSPIGFLKDLRDAVSEPADDCYEHLQKIRDRRDYVTIRTSLRTFTSMVLKNLSIPRAQGRGDELRFTATFQQVQTVSNKRVRRTATPAGKGKNKYGLSLDKLLDADKVLWRKGKPPGLSPSTEPKGEIIGEEVLVVYKEKGSKAAGKVCHLPNKPGGTPTPLTVKENQNFAKDLNRDNALNQRRQLKRIDDRLKANDDRLERAQKFLDYKEAHPGEKVDPAMFGF